jgi:hypothetical protein
MAPAPSRELPPDRPRPPLRATLLHRVSTVNAVPTSERNGNTALSCENTLLYFAERKKAAKTIPSTSLPWRDGGYGVVERVVTVVPGLAPAWPRGSCRRTWGACEVVGTGPSVVVVVVGTVTGL